MVFDRVGVHVHHSCFLEIVFIVDMYLHVYEHVSSSIRPCHESGHEKTRRLVQAWLVIIPGLWLCLHHSKTGFSPGLMKIDPLIKTDLCIRSIHHVFLTLPWPRYYCRWMEPGCDN